MEAQGRRRRTPHGSVTLEASGFVISYVLLSVVIYLAYLRMLVPMGIFLASSIVILLLSALRDSNEYDE